MADVNAQVALGINSPDPNQGLNTLNKIMGLGSAGLGIRQQQQALQTGQSIQQSAQAKATIDTENAKEYQGLASLMSDPVKNGIVDQDGNPTPDAQKIIMRTAPNIGQDHYEKLLSAATKKVGFNSAVNTLRTQDRTELANGITGVAARAQSPSDITDTLDNIVESKKGTPEYGNYQTIAGTMKEAINHLAKQTGGSNPPPPGKEPWRVGAANIASSMGGGAPTAQNTGAGVVSRDPILGGLSQPPGAPTGSAINPTPPQVAGQTTRQVGTGNADIDKSNEVSALQQQSSAAIPLTQRIDQLARDINSGKVAKMISETGNYFGISSINEARSQLTKDLGQVKGLAVAKAGSDQRAATILEGYPTDTTPENTIHAAMDYIRGTARQNLSRGKLLSKYQEEDPQGLRGFQAADNMLTRTTDPLMHEYLALKPEEQAGFYRRNFSTPQQAQEFKNQINALKKHTSVLQ